MSDELKAKIAVYVDSEEHRNQCIGYSEGMDCCLEKPEVLKNIDQVYQEKQHTNALIWYEHLINDLINDDGLKRSDHLGRILEYARIAAGLSEEDVKITLPDEYIPHDSEFIAEHISPVVKVSKDAGFIAEWEVDRPMERDHD